MFHSDDASHGPLNRIYLLDGDRYMPFLLELPGCPSGQKWPFYLGVMAGIKGQARFEQQVTYARGYIVSGSHGKKFLAEGIEIG